MASLCVPQHVLGFMGSAGCTESQEEKRNQEGGKHNPTVTHKHHQHHTKGKLCGTWNFYFMEFYKGVGQGGGDEGQQLLGFLEDSGPLEMFLS